MTFLGGIITLTSLFSLASCGEHPKEYLCGMFLFVKMSSLGFHPVFITWSISLEVSQAVLLTHMLGKFSFEQ